MISCSTNYWDNDIRYGGRITHFPFRPGKQHAEYEQAYVRSTGYPVKCVGNLYEENQLGQ